MNHIKKIIVVAIATIISAGAMAQAPKQTPSDGIFLRVNQVYYIKKGMVNKLPAGDQDLAGVAKVNAMGFMTYADGRTHQLVAGELADFNATIHAGAITEFVTVQNGSAVINTNGIISPIDVDFKFANDMQVDANGTLSNGQTLKAGEKIGMNGEILK